MRNNLINLQQKKKEITFANKKHENTGTFITLYQGKKIKIPVFRIFKENDVLTISFL